MRVLIVGSRSKLAGEIVKFGNENLSFSGLDCDGFNLTTDVVKNFDLVLNCAAKTDQKWCDRNPDTSLMVNGILPIYLSEICNKAGVQMIQITTNYELADPTKWNEYTKAKAFASDRLGEHVKLVYTSFFDDAWLESVNAVNKSFESIKDHISLVAERIALICEHPEWFPQKVYLGNPTRQPFYKTIEKYKRVELTDDEKFLPPVDSMFSYHWLKFELQENDFKKLKPGIKEY